MPIQVAEILFFCMVFVRFYPFQSQFSQVKITNPSHSEAAPVSSTPGAAGPPAGMAVPNLANPSGLNGMPLPVAGQQPSVVITAIIDLTIAI